MGGQRAGGQVEAAERVYARSSTFANDVDPSHHDLYFKKLFQLHCDTDKKGAWMCHMSQALSQSLVSHQSGGTVAADEGCFIIRVSWRASAQNGIRNSISGFAHAELSVPRCCLGIPSVCVQS